MRFPTMAWMLMVSCVVVGENFAFGQTPATQPTTRGAARGAGRGGGRGPISSSPREKLPFTNGDPAAINGALPTLFITGDSTAAKNNDADHRGWGAVLVDYFDAGKINLVNMAQGGASFPSYYASSWPRVIAAVRAGDFVIVEFGHNGGQLQGMGPETRPGQLRTGMGPMSVVHTYGWYVRTFIQDVRAKGATPIISSTTVRNMWTNPNGTFRDGTLTQQSPGYDPAADRIERGMGNLLPTGERTMLVWARQVSAEEKTAFVDHSDITADVFEKLGRVAVQKYFPADHTHTSTDGGVLNAEAFLAGLKGVADPLGTQTLIDDLNEKGKAIAAYKPVQGSR